MCLSFLKKKKSNKITPIKKYTEDHRKEYSSNEHILCHGCKKCFSLESEEIKIHCGGCDKFFHCCIAGKCVGPNCTYVEKITGANHSLSWCIYCVPGLKENKVNGETCICEECYDSIQ